MAENVTLYTIGCPQCKLLAEQMDAHGIEYSTVTDENVMIEKGFKAAPMLEVGDNTYNFVQAMQWLRGVAKDGHTN